jgi:PKD repeat protein
VAFANDSTGQAPLSYGWDFGDGMTDTITNPVHIYPGFGTYTATLTVDNVLGTDVVSATIMLAEPTHVYLPFIQNEGSLGH